MQILTKILYQFKVQMVYVELSLTLSNDYLVSMFASQCTFMTILTKYFKCIFYLLKGSFHYKDYHRNNINILLAIMYSKERIFTVCFYYIMILPIFIRKCVAFPQSNWRAKPTLPPTPPTKK